MSPALPRPVIGIVPDFDPEQRRYLVADAYIEAVAVAGGVPVILTRPEAGSGPVLPDVIQGLLLTGSKFDVDPHRYGASHHPALGPVSPERDQQDLAWLAWAYVRRMPILAICYGCQILNVFRGGTLYQDLASQRPEALDHRRHDRPQARVHDIVFVPSSRFSQQVGLPRTRVNSTHHQAVKELSEEFRPVAHSPDGVVEAFESREEGHWVMGIQWHPERIWREEPASQAVFQQFVHAATAYLQAPAGRAG